MKITEITRVNKALNKLSKLYREAKIRKLSALGLHAGQDVLLWILAQADGGMTVSELAEQLGIESPTVTRSLSRMEKSELFRREPVPSDRRQVKIVLTAGGRDIIKSIEVVWAELAHDTLGSLSANKRDAIISAIEAANEHLINLVGRKVLAED